MPEKKRTSLYQIKATYKLLVFWASWRGPCLAEIPQLDSLYKKEKDNGLQILCINVDNSPDKWLAYIPKYTFDCYHLYQGNPRKSSIYKYFNISFIPFMVLLDADNKIIQYNTRLDKLPVFN